MKKKTNRGPDVPGTAVKADRDRDDAAELRRLLEAAEDLAVAMHNRGLDVRISLSTCSSPYRFEAVVVRRSVEEDL